MALSFGVSGWSGWCEKKPELLCSTNSKLTVSGTPDVSSIPPMLRRKLNHTGRASAAEALQFLASDHEMPIVYCSQHGDIHRTMAILNNLTNGEPVSPTHFSLAVHNAICGVISIHTGNHAAISTLSFGQEGLVPALLEALGIIDSGAPKVLCIIGDTSLPDIFYDSASPDEIPYATAFVMVGGEVGDIELRMLQENGDESEVRQGYCDALRFIEFLGSQRRSCLFNHNGCTWQVARKAG
jgi:hypothetical protein